MTGTVALEVSSELANLGVRRLINCGGVRSRYGGSFTLPEVYEAMAEARNTFVDMEELLERSGEHIGRLLSCDSGLVTAGAAAGLSLLTAAALVDSDPIASMLLPAEVQDRRVVVLPRGHLSPYDVAVTAVGALIVEIDTVDDILEIQDRIAMFLFVGLQEDSGPLAFAQFLAAAREVGRPIVVDAASELLTAPERWTGLGADAAIYSGGKRIGGPNGAGVIVGKRDLIRSARVHAAPHFGVGRSLKVTIEEVLGTLKAIEVTARSGSPLWCKERSEYVTGVLDRFATAFLDTPHVTTEIIPGHRYLPIPRLRVTWDSGLEIAGIDVLNELHASSQPIIIEELWVKPRSIVLDAFCLLPGQEEVVLLRLTEILSDSSRAASSPQRQIQDPLYAVDGEWLLEIHFPSRLAKVTLNLNDDAGRISGSLSMHGLTGQVEGYCDGSNVDFCASVQLFGQCVTLTFNGDVERTGIAGELCFGRVLPIDSPVILSRNSLKYAWSAKKLASGLMQC